MNDGRKELEEICLALKAWAKKYEHGYVSAYVVNRPDKNYCNAYANTDPGDKARYIDLVSRDEART